MSGTVHEIDQSSLHPLVKHPENKLCPLTGIEPGLVKMTWPLGQYSTKELANHMLI